MKLDMAWMMVRKASQRMQQANVSTRQTRYQARKMISLLPVAVNNLVINDGAVAPEGLHTAISV